MRKAIAALSLALTAVAACGGSRAPAPYVPPVPFDDPLVGIRDVRLAGAGLTGGSMDIVVSVYNPNDYDVQAPRLSYQLYVGETRLSDGYYDTPISLPARDSATVKIPATFSYLTARRAGMSIAGTGTVDYRMLGRISVGTPYGRMSAPYDRMGRFAPLSVGFGGR